MATFGRTGKAYGAAGQNNARLTLKLPSSTYDFRVIAADLAVSAACPAVVDRKGVTINIAGGKTPGVTAVDTTTGTVALTGTGYGTSDTWYGMTMGATVTGPMTLYALINPPAANSTTTGTIVQYGAFAINWYNGFPVFAGASTIAPISAALPKVPIVLSFTVNGASSVARIGETEYPCDAGSPAASAIFSISKQFPGVVYEAVGYKGVAHDAATRAATHAALRAWYRV